jgi:Tol biopolymer transport system component
MVAGNWNMWLVDSETGERGKITSESPRENGAVSSPDGSRIVFSSMVSAPIMDLFEMPLAGGPAKLLLKSPESKIVQDWSADGGYILYVAQRRSFDLWALPLSGNKNPIPVAQTEFTESSGRFSPDGLWVAYVSDESGRPEVYVQAFPDPGNRVKISVEGGSLPNWREGGRELFYLSLDSQLIAVEIRYNGSRIERGKQLPLFPVRPGSTYAPAPDGKRFLINALVEDPPITILLNWKPKAK